MSESRDTHSQKLLQLDIDADTSASLLLDPDILRETHSGKPAENYGMKLPISDELRAQLESRSLRIAKVVLILEPTEEEETDTDDCRKARAAFSSSSNRNKAVYCYADGAGDWRCVP